MINQPELMTHKYIYIENIDKEMPDGNVSG